ncbi:VanZ family protein [Phenylobacterium soli]|uniref:VanZ family protein n=1 Tax=Phenylobacterium soli TaxID=2170551 RepID=A0A328ALA1_9CAUL|nr:VanZ family protein [Phenylobacterium soli]RAK53638.1 VanZ family protein [Phenylobacterium soli]
MGIDRLPVVLRLGLYALAIAVLLYLCLAPARELPQVSLWDKAEHATAWAVLAGLGLVLFPARPWRVAGFALALGVLVEVLQGTPAIHRDSDWRDVVADTVGVTVAGAGFALVGRRRA